MKTMKLAIEVAFTGVELLALGVFILALVFVYVVFQATKALRS